MEEFIGAFHEEQIDEEAFRLLDNATITSIFKKAGLILKFKNRFEQFLIENWVNQSENSASTITVSSLSPSTSFTSANEANLSSEIILMDNEPGTYLMNQKQQTVESVILMPPPHQLPRPLVLDEAPPAKKIKTSCFPDGGLEELLKKTLKDVKFCPRK